MEDVNDRYLEWCQFQGIESDDDSYYRFMGEEELKEES